MTQDNERRRIQAILQIRLDGAEEWDARDFIAQKEAAGEDPWTVADGAGPLTVDQVAAIIEAADKVIADAYPDDPPDVARHKAKLKNLYARAVTAGEIATAARILRDIADLEQLPEKAARTPTPNEKKAALLLEIHRRHLAVLDAPRPSEELFEHGPVFSAVQWFDCADDDAERMRWSRALADLIGEGLAIESREAGAKWSNVRLSPAGEQIIEALADAR
jgi:hypothetical protein